MSRWLQALLCAPFALSLMAGAANSRAIQGTWTTQARDNRGRNGERFTYRFPGQATLAGSVWGTGLYTDDSSIAMAAVQEGLITPEDGGVVTIEIRPGATSYRGSVRNGVRSGPFGVWQGSFVFVDRGEFREDPPPPAVERRHEEFRDEEFHHEESSYAESRHEESRHEDRRREARPFQGDWSTKADGFRGRNGERFTFTFPYGGNLGSVWGTGLYTDDSSIATAAVHAGLISPEDGGTVTIEIRPGARSYQGTQRHGVNTAAYGAWQGSFIFVD